MPDLYIIKSTLSVYDLCPFIVIVIVNIFNCVCRLFTLCRKGSISYACIDMFCMSSMYWSLKHDHVRFVDIIIGFVAVAHSPPNSAVDRIILA